MILVCASVQLPASSSDLLQMLEAAARLNRHTLLEHGMPSHSKDNYTVICIDLTGNSVLDGSRTSHLSLQMVMGLLPT